MPLVYVIKYGEIALRGKNRGLYENMLLAAVRRNLGEDGGLTVYKEQGRFIAEGTPRDAQAALAAITDTFGVFSAAAGVKTSDQSIGGLCAAALQVMQGVKTPATFKVETTRADKRYPMPSNDVSAAVGEYLLEHVPGLTVRMKSPDVRLRVELRTDAYVYADERPGLCGLPPNSNGRGVLLLSGGFDSPVAGFMAARRGVELTAAYFESPPYTSDRARQKVMDLSARLAHYTGRVRLYCVPFTDVQLRLRDAAPESKLTILLKRAMLRAATLIAGREAAHVLITGDSVGQVASQTTQALAAVESATDLPILRPLCAMDKREIIEWAKRIGTHDISVLPYEDCCTLFVPERPETKPKRGIIEAVERDLFRDGLGEMIEAAAAGVEAFDLGGKP